MRVTARFDADFVPDHDCIPLALLEDTDVLDDLLLPVPPGLRRVYSHDELERSIEAHLRLEIRRRGLTPEEIEIGDYL